MLTMLTNHTKISRVISSHPQDKDAIDYTA